MDPRVSTEAVSALFANPKPEEGADLVIQVTNLEPKGKSYGFEGSDGRKKIKGIFSSRLSQEIVSGNIQNLALIRLIDYTVNDIPNKPDKYLIVTKCDVVCPALDKEVKVEDVDGGESMVVLQPKQETDDKSEIVSRAVVTTGDIAGGGVLLKPKQETASKSVAQIVHEQRTNMAPAARMSMSKRVHPLASLNPYQGNWTIKVRVTNKGNMRTYKNMRGEGCVFNVELTDQDGTQIQATMFNEAARKFFDKFELGKVYFISKGTLKVANKQFKMVQNDYEMTLNDNSEVEEASNEASFVPEIKFSFVPIDHLGLYINSKELIDVIGVVQSVSPSMSIRRKSNNDSIPKRDITIADETKKTVVVSLWNELATGVGQELLDIADQSPVIAIKSLRVGDFQGVTLSTVTRSAVQINPDLPEAKKLRMWYDSEGKDTSMASLGSTLSPSSKSGGRSMYSDRVTLSHITSNPSLGEDKPVFYSIRAFVSFVKPDQTMWYRACKTCKKKVTDGVGGGYWCEACQKNDDECCLRYIMVVKVSDESGECWVSAFNDEAEKIIGYSADELDKLKSEGGDGSGYQQKLKEATWNPHLFRVSVSQNDYNNEKRQRITVRDVAPVNFAAESRFLLEEISKMQQGSHLVA